MLGKLSLWKTNFSNKFTIWRKNIPTKLHSYKKRILELKPTDVLLIGIVLNIFNKLFFDTASKHNLPTIPLQYWSVVLLVFLLISSIPLLWNAPSNFQNNVLSYAVMLSFIGSILDILEFSLDIFTYKLVLTFISILTFISLIKVRSFISRIYVGLFLLVFYDFLTLIYDYFKYYKEIKVVFEILFVFGVSYYIYKSNFRRKQLSLILISVVVGRLLGAFVINRDLPSTIFLIVFNQLTGSTNYAIDFYGIELTETTIFILHITEIVILAVVLILNRPSTLLLMIVLTGFNMTYAPLAGLRAIAIMYHFNRNNPNVNRIYFGQRSEDLRVQ